MSMQDARTRTRNWMATGAIFLLTGMCLPPLHAAPAKLQPMQSFVEEKDADQDSGDRAQETRDREREARDRDQEKRDRAQERVEHLQEIYDNGRDALDEDRFERAEEKFGEVAKMNAAQADAALYWKAYAQNKLGKRDAALATIADLKQRFPQSRWQKDAGALEIEVRQSSGQPTKPESQNDDELKMLAIQGLMNSAPERAMPLLEKVLNGTGSPKEKSRALRDGAKRIAGSAGNPGENGARPRQSGPATEGCGVSGDIRRGGCAQDARGGLRGDERPVSEARGA